MITAYLMTGELILIIVLCGKHLPRIHSLSVGVFACALFVLLWPLFFIWKPPHGTR